jgi:RimJ/RimL family protein N-acetyltransferase
VTDHSFIDTSAPASSKLVQLRPARAEDAALLLKWRFEPAVAQFQPLLNIPLDQLEADLVPQDWEKFSTGEQDKFQWIIMVGEAAAGWVTLVVTSWDHGLAEVGYSLATVFQRQRLMPPALQLVLVEVFLRTSLARLEARCAIENEGSWKVLETVGFRREGTLKDYFVLNGRRVDNYLYAILRSEFLP